MFLTFTLFASEKFDTRDIKWAPDGKGFVLLDRDQYCCAFEVEEEKGDSAASDMYTLVEECI